MVLPIVTHLAQCTELTTTVIPYLPQLNDLPQQLFQSYNDPAALKAIYLATNPLITAFAFSLFISPIFLLVSEINKNYSQVDRVWSILPTIYNFHYWYYARSSGFNTELLDVLVTFSSIWSLRLTYNYWRKGGYSIGSEDYRWEVLRKKLGPTLFFIFNVLFISTAQSILLFLITTPTYVLLLSTLVPGAESSATADTIFVRVELLVVMFEFFADQEQWNYHKAKESYQATAKVPRGYFQEDLDRGFLCSGIWAYSRHPNFAAEQLVWVLLYQWGCWDSNTMFNWTFAGAGGYMILFQASTWFTELITGGKYPEYEIYQERVGKFLPKVNEVIAGRIGIRDYVDEEEEQTEQTVAEIKEKTKEKTKEKSKSKGKGKK